MAARIMMAGKILGSTKKCHFCGNSLSLLQRIRDARFCSEEHHERYLARQEQRGIQELFSRKSAAPRIDAPAAASSPPGEDVAAIAESTRMALVNMQAAVCATAREAGRAAEAQSASLAAEAQYRFLKHVLDHLPGGVAVFAAADRVVYFNETYRAIWPETGGREPLKVRRSIAAALEAGTEGRELRIVLKPGQGGTVRLKFAPIPSLDGGPAQLMVHATRVLPAPARRKGRAEEVDARPNHLHSLHPS